MNNFVFHSPTEFIFGKGTEEQVGVLLKKYGARKVLIHYGGGSVIHSGLLPKVQKILEQEQIEYFLLGGVQPNPRSGLVYEGIEICKKENIDFLLPIGGGSVIDSAKAIAAGAVYDGDFWDFFTGKAQITKALKIGVILTIPASGSEGSHRTIITHENGMLKRGAGNVYVRPTFSIINPELTYTLPLKQTSAGIVDMMSHIFERYITKTQNVELTDHLCEGTLTAIISAARKVMKDPFDYDARATLCWAGTIAHNGQLGVGRSEDWTTHNLEHELSGLYDVTHGVGLAVMFPAYMTYVLDRDVDLFYRLAVRVWNIPEDETNKRGVAVQGIAAMKSFFKEIHMPTSFAEIDAKEEDIDLLVEKLFVGKGAKFPGYAELTPEEAKAVYRLACK